MPETINLDAVKANENAEHKIATRLFKARTRSGIYRSELAEMLEVDEVELARYENSLEAIPASLLVVAAAFMGVDLDYFYNDEEPITINANSNRKAEVEQPALT